MTLKNISFFIIILLFASSLTAQNLEKVDQYLQQVFEEGVTPGFAVAIVRNNKIIFKKGYGKEVLGNKKPMRTTSSSAIGSFTKSLTAIAILQLKEAGKLNLDDPIIKHLPWFKTANKSRSDKITIRMCLNNTSGLYGGSSKIDKNNDLAIEQLIRSLENIYLHREPGSSYEYSNVGWSVLGLIISKVSGLSYSDYLQKNIFDPLNMSKTSTDPEQFEDIEVLYGHYYGIGRGIPASRETNSIEFAPAGSLTRSTVEDLGKLLAALLNDGAYEGQQILSEESIQTMWKPNVAFPGLSIKEGGDGNDWHYGLGWMISKIEGTAYVHHGGSTGTMSSLNMIDPQKKIAITFLSNLDFNFLNNHQYRTDANIVNNIFSILSDQNTSSFGIPIEDDPTINDFELGNFKFEKYIGAYKLSSSKANWIFAGAKLNIEKSNNRIIGKIYRGNQYLSIFNVDFINESRAVSRNIATPSPIFFKINPMGKVTSVTVFNTTFTKHRTDCKDCYQSHHSKKKNIAFDLPKGWQVTWVKNNFRISNPKYEMTYIHGEVVNENTIPFDNVSMNDISSASISLARFFPNWTLKKTGKQLTENIGVYFWNEQSLLVEINEKPHQQLIFSTHDHDKSVIAVLTTPLGQLTQFSRELVSPIMESISLKHSQKELR